MRKQLIAVQGLVSSTEVSRTIVCIATTSAASSVWAGPAVWRDIWCQCLSRWRTGSMCICLVRTEILQSGPVERPVYCKQWCVKLYMTTYKQVGGRRVGWSKNECLQSEVAEFILPRPLSSCASLSFCPPKFTLLYIPLRIVHLSAVSPL